ncbi:ATP-binding cassette domain-containing protein [Jatrophihabitans telluris]|uniref:ATP-binding cassette domain-containing protein n=1 Tax=Jatrophihabitans telluris TaxID=2038343 RepID=A0ABY4QVM1_9ACTN|nr:ATP-binding cassette domain-containing protein [Jatrophihabitans telluris]UQX86911.1 ATP-binding cassette domain-containing protein [Jatrophihabitans telluris]
MSPGRHAAPDPEQEQASLSPVVSAASELGYVRGGRAVLDGITLTLRAAEAVAVVGPSGSGKSSLLALLAGLERPDAGSVTAVADGIRVGLVLQGYGLVSVLTAAENVEAALQAMTGEPGLTRREVRRRADAALDAVGLRPVADHLVEELSGGQQQRVAIARALVIEPTVLFADELTAELDHEWKAIVVGLVLDVARSGGLVVLATHDPDISSRCDRTVRLVDGRLT